MATITINSVTFSPTPTGSTLTGIRYRKDEIPELPWIEANPGGTIIPSSGVLPAPLVIGGLLAATDYEIWVRPKCGAVPYTVIITTAAASCPNILSIETVITN